MGYNWDMVYELMDSVMKEDLDRNMRGGAIDIIMDSMAIISDAVSLSCIQVGAWNNKPGLAEFNPITAPSIFYWWETDVPGWVQDIVDGTILRLLS